MDELRYQIDLLRAMNQKLDSEAKMYRSVCNTSSNAFLYYSFEEDTARALGNWDRFFPFEIHTIRDLAKICDVVKEEYILPLREAFSIEKKGLDSITQEFCMQDGIVWVECEINVSYDETGSPREKVFRFRDISKFKRQNDDLLYMAYYDTLTGLYNRNYFVKILSEWVRRAEEDSSVVSVMFIDIDDFRKINDGMGILVGDELIQSFGQFLSTFVEDNHVICSHFNSDLYGMAVYEPFGKRSVEHIYQVIHERIQKPFRLTTNHNTQITVSVGVAEYPEAARTALELINCAEIVMFKAKHTGKDKIHYFDAPIINEFLQNVTIEHKLRKAIFNQDFMLYYQPQFDAGTGRLRGVEALIRWKDEEDRMISPALFIPIAEKNGMIVPIGDWVIEQSVQSLARWERKYGCDIVMSINISAVQYKAPDFVAKIKSVVEKYQVKPAKIELEITESVLIDDLEEITRKMAVLQEYGMRISVDDFGTGYSSLSYLKGLPINTLKIDKSFVDTVVTDEASRIIVEAIVNMVNKLGFETIAEGVEIDRQLEYLREIGCEYIQGYLLGKPLPREEAEELVRKQMR